jgi:hypothetical protein
MPSPINFPLATAPHMGIDPVRELFRRTPVLQGDPLFGKVFYTPMENAGRHGKIVTEIVFSCNEEESGSRSSMKTMGKGSGTAEREHIPEKIFQT